MKSIFKTYLITVFAAIILFSSCEEDGGMFKSKLYDDSNLLITEYLETNENTGIMLQLLKMGKQDALLNTYGNYTVFVPSDSAFSAYFASIGKSGPESLDSNEVKELLDFHVLLNEIDVKTKNTGILGYSDTTISGVRHVIDLSEGFNKIKINKQSTITGDIEMSNGIIYNINKVLAPHPNNIYDYLVSTGNFTIFSAAIVTTGLKDTLQKLSYPNPYTDISGLLINPFFTIFAESDAVFNAGGINSVESLKSEVWSKNGSQAPYQDKALKDFMLYHVMSGLRTSFSMYREENLVTLGANMKGIIHIDEPVDIRKPDPVLNSSIQQDGSVTGGIRLNNESSDVSCKNGIVHQPDGILFINNNYRQTKIYRECEDGIVFFQTRDGFKFYSAITTIGGRGLTRGYYINAQYYSSSINGVGAIDFYPVDKEDWIEFTIQNIIPGNYNVYINYLRDINNVSDQINVYFRNANDIFSWEEQLFKAGFKMADKATTTGGYPQFRQNNKLGTITVEKYDNYIFRFAHVDGAYGIYDNIILEPVE